MKKISTETINKIIKEQKITEYYYSVGESVPDMPVIGVYHKNDWDHGYDGHSGFSGSRREFYKNFFEMMDFLESFFRRTSCSKCIIAPFKRYKHFSYYDTDNDIFAEIHHILKINNIRSNSHAGIELSLKNEFSLLEAFIEGAFRGISLSCIYLDEINVLLTPTHHFEIPFWTYNIEKYTSIVKEIAGNYDNLCFYGSD